jgi:Hypothetical protein (DUF2513)
MLIRLADKRKFKDIAHMTPTSLEDTVSPLPSASESEMNRNMDLMRDILLAFEADQKLDGSRIYRARAGDVFKKEGVSEEEIAYGLRLLMDRALVIGSYDKTSGIFDVERLSNDGHDFLDSTRSPDIWNKVKKEALAAGGGTLDILMKLAAGYIKKRLEDSTGIKL